MHNRRPCRCTGAHTWNNGPMTDTASRPETGPTLPDRPSLEGLEEKWEGVWSEQQLFAFDRETTREQVFSVDTPPPTASGSLHVGHVFGYSQADMIVRYQRMSGKNRSEEHTSELQSRGHLVCRLLLEKQKRR